MLLHPRNLLQNTGILRLLHSFQDADLLFLLHRLFQRADGSMVLTESDYPSTY